MSEIRGLTDQAIDTNRPSRSSLDGDLPADPPSPLTAEEEAELRAYVAGSHPSRNSGYAMRQWQPGGPRSADIVRLLATLDAARAPADPSLVLVHRDSGGVFPDGTTNHPAIDFDAEPLASSPAPAGLDVERLATALDEAWSPDDVFVDDATTWITLATSAAMLYDLWTRAATRPAPAGLDVLNEAICIVSETPTLGLADALTFRAAVLERLNALRAATRPAGGAGERP